MFGVSRVRHLAVIVAVWASIPAVGRSQAPAPSPAPMALVNQYCVTCHNQRLNTGDLSLDRPSLRDIAGHADVWERVLTKLRSGSMPPRSAPRPDAAAMRSLIASIEDSIDRAAAVRPNPGLVPLHRLNRAEYENVIRDLLGVEIDGRALLPADDTGFGFDNVADVLSVSPMLMERYMTAAATISRIAVGDTTIRPGTEIHAVNKYLRQDDRVSETLPFASRAGLAVHRYFPVDADYVVKIFFTRTYDGRLKGLGEPNRLEIRVNDVKVKEVSVGGGGDPDEAEANVRASQRQGSRALDVDGMEVRFPAKAGPGVVAVSFLKPTSKAEGMLRPTYSVTSYEYAGDASAPAGIANIEIRGPYDVKGPGESPSRQRIFTCHQDDLRCARQILSTLARRAYRRPVTDADLQPLLMLYSRTRRTSTFDAGIQTALERVLVSPDFLFRAERTPSNAARGAAHRISDVELASRVSFFLWSSMPDDELLGLAERGLLRRPDVLEKQVRRMLADQRADALIENFSGQWLYLRNVNLVSPDPYAFPDFDENLRLAFQREADLFIKSQIRDDHRIVDLLTADYTFLNERLAKHYGIPNVYGTHFRRVTLPDETRAGLLGKGAILTLTSYANRTAPTLRGKWLLENLLGTPPPPPPPNVPSLKEAGEDIKSLSMRQRMELHRTDAACSSCHRLMDPIGFALENFDAVGRWRTTSEVGTPIDATGQLADGTPVDGPASLRAALLNHREEFITTATSKLLTYALGRGVEYYDGPAVRQILREAASTEHRWSALIVAITKSVPFQMRTEARAPVVTTAAVRKVEP